MKKYLGLLASVGLACVPTIAAADDAAAAPAAPAGPTLDAILTNSGITEAGHLSASYTGGFNKGQVLAYRAFDTDSNSFEFNQAALTLSKLPTTGFGVLVNMTAGSDAKVVNGSYGSGSGDFALTQGYLQYATGPFTVIAGRYVTLAGAEVIDDSADTNISRSFLFQEVEPLVHTGVRGSYAVTGTVTAYLGVNNSAVSGDSLDTDKTKTAETGLAYTSTDKKIAAAVYDYYGVDNAGGINFKDNYLDTTDSYQATDKLQLVLNGDYYRYTGGGVGGYAYGIALYGNYQFTDTWKGSLRAEYVSTKNQLTYAVVDDKTPIEEVTATVGYSPVKNVTILGEVRYDFSDKQVYPDPATAVDPNLSKSQGDVGLKAIYTFGNS
jgi:hypothetical protein